MFFEKNPIRDGVERRLWVGAVICALSLVLGYFVLVKTSRGHRIDNAAYSGRDAVLSQEVSQFHGDLLDLVNKKGLLLAAGFLLVLAAAVHSPGLPGCVQDRGEPKPDAPGPRLLHVQLLR